ncbi:MULTISPECIES: helical backbone metal receptor [Altibacter]|uniref:ABC transporter substrate-binding protein n=1 Tax=Altibacter TaxID=1535231 RepID=UPI00054D3D8F|nr:MULTISPECIES: helical backbone metal receptor [Altibacter]MCW8979920.1 helical backbone metal receptor [Altibacter sp.]MCW9038162.1 helical backbone metal receptor [Altibacter sp.]
MLVKDQLHRELVFKKTPQRIVSLVPSQTELLVDLQLKEQLVGITKFCVHPGTLRNEIEVVGGTKQVHIDKIRSLAPDVIICNKEENTEAMVNDLTDVAPVWVSDIVTLEDSYGMIDALGSLFDRTERASAIIRKIKEEAYQFSKQLQQKEFKKVAYLIWKDPYMVAGGKTFINSLLRLNKFQNIFTEAHSRYPVISLEEMQGADLILLSSEPFPFKENDVLALKKALQKEVLLVDGEYFSWYGSRLEKAFQYFKKLH